MKIVVCIKQVPDTKGGVKFNPDGTLAVSYTHLDVYKRQLYIGNGQIVHASTAKTGIIVSNADYKKVLAVRRIF